MSKIIQLPRKLHSDLIEYLPADETLSKLASFFSVFSDSTRIKILSALCLGEMCVNDLAVVLNLNQTTLSHQLKYLKTNGAVKCRRDGKIIYYSIASANVNEVMMNGVNYLLAN